MPLALADHPPAASLSRSPWIGLLTRMAEETELDGLVRVAGDVLPVPHGGSRLVVATLADALHARYFRFSADPHLTLGPAKRHSGGIACMRLGDALTPEFLGRSGWDFAYRIEGGAAVFVVTAGGLDGRPTASCFLDLAPAIAPEVFGRLVTALDGYGLGFRAELRGDPGMPERIGSVVITVARTDATALARVALRMRQRSPFVFGRSVPAFTRPLAPGVAIADEPGTGTDFGRHRCRLVATGLVFAVAGAGPGERRAAVLRALTDASLDPAALHLNPGNPEFDLRR
jgi:hypothetical protein